MGDSNATLWASWVIIDNDLRVFFSGDTGYFDGFKEIGHRYGPFDLTMLETGAYDPEWPDVHMQPEQTLQAHLDLKVIICCLCTTVLSTWRFMLGTTHLNVLSLWLNKII